MGHSTRCMGGIISFVDTDFKCPKCEYQHEEKDYYSKLNNSKNGITVIKCNGCKTRIGVTVDMRGDVKVWLKDEEEKI